MEVAAALLGQAKVRWEADQTGWGTGKGVVILNTVL